MLIFGITLSQNEAVMEKNYLSVDVLNENDKGFRRSMNLFIPAEIGNNGKINAKEGPRDGLDLSLKPKTQILDTTCDQSCVTTH